MTSNPCARDAAFLLEYYQGHTCLSTLLIRRSSILQEHLRRPQLLIRYNEPAAHQRRVHGFKVELDPLLVLVILTTDRLLRSCQTVVTRRERNAAVDLIDLVWSEDPDLTTPAE